MSQTRLWTKNICPLRFSSRSTALRISSGSKRATRVSTASRSSGGVCRFEMSRSPSSAMWSVRGIGVAVIVSTSTDWPQGLEPLLDLDAETLLLVDDHQAEVVEADVGLGQAVRADHDVDRAGFEPLDDLALLLARGEPRERGDLEGELGHAVGERAVVLLGQHGGGHQHRHLVAGVDRLERRAHRHFRLAEADVAAEQPVHGPRLASCRA